MIPSLVAYAARGTLIALFALAVQASLRQRGTATSRHLGLALALAAMLIEPALAAVVPAWRVVLPWGGGALAGHASCAPAVAAAPWWAPLGWAPPVVWLLGAVLVTCKHIAGYRRAAALAGRTTELHEPAWKDLVREVAAHAGTPPPPVRVSDELGGPVVAGVWHPVVLLPRAALDWEHARARMTLLHELAHVLRRDGLTQLLAHAVTVAHWFNPLAWYVAAQLRHERELAADERVLQIGASASDYAEHLVTTARALLGPPPQGFLAMASRSRLGDRIEAVLTFDSACRVRTLGRIGMVFAVGLASLTAAALQPS
ncbi:MAG TPA: M56 family metallopeptidase, partial [Polyangiaceae bacterium]|nr:M56 family metallopeptidase [Polyangiaceae bacterium]